MIRVLPLVNVLIRFCHTAPCALAPNGRMLCCSPDDAACIARLEKAREEPTSAPPGIVEPSRPSMIGAMHTFGNATVWDRSSEYDVAVVGVPFGLTLGYEAPGMQLVRRESSRILPYSRSYGRSLDDFVVVDCQDVVVNGVDRMKELVKSLLPFFKTGKALIALGGDQSILSPLLTAAQTVLGPFAIIHIDRDLGIGTGLREQSLSPSTAVFWAAAQSLVDTRHSIHVGARSNLASQRMQLIDEELGFETISAEDIALSGVREVVLRIKSRLSRRDGSFMPAYISLDLDVLDRAFYPASGEIGGLSVKELRAILRGLKDFCYVVGADVRDVAPLSDPAAGEVAATIVHDLVLLAAGRSMGHEIVSPNLQKSAEL